MSDTLVSYDAFTVHFNSERGIANCAVYELVNNELNGMAERSDEFMADPEKYGYRRGLNEETDRSFDRYRRTVKKQ
jgi:DNA/RNA endonuclease G (NUC1)